MTQYNDVPFNYYMHESKEIGGLVFHRAWVNGKSPNAYFPHIRKGRATGRTKVRKL